MSGCARTETLAPGNMLAGGRPMLLILGKCCSATMRHLLSSRVLRRYILLSPTF